MNLQSFVEYNLRTGSAKTVYQAPDQPNPKVQSLESLQPLCEQWRRAGKQIVLTNGHFELLHPGHVRYLQSARALGDYLIVGLNADTTTRKLKGPGRPVLDQNARAEVLAALAAVDFVVIFDDDTAERLVEALRPNTYVKGGDYDPSGGKALPEAEVVRRYGGRVVLAPLASGFSTTRLLREIARRFGQAT